MSSLRWDLIAPIAVFVILVLTGTTTSSLGIGYLTVDGQPETTPIGNPLDVRSDEYRTNTPILLGISVMGESTQLNPLSVNDDFSNKTPGGPFSSVVFFTSAILQLGTIFPSHILFAFLWWFPVLLLALGLPFIYAFLTGVRWPGWIAFALIFLSPVVAWWSYSAAIMLGFVAAGSAALIKTVKYFEAKSWWKVSAWAVVATILLARTPYAYQPWMLVLAPVVLFMVIVPLLADKKLWKSRLAVIGGIALAAITLFILSVLEIREGLEAITNTVYPVSYTHLTLPTN